MPHAFYADQNRYDDIYSNASINIEELTYKLDKALDNNTPLKFIKNHMSCYCEAGKQAINDIKKLFNE